MNPVGLGNFPPLSERERKTLLAIASAALRGHLLNRPLEFKLPPPGRLRDNRGAFVTWKKGDELRGCIGTLQGSNPLWETVLNMAVASGTRDTRFFPIELGEFDLLSVDISALTPFFPIKDIAEIQVGVHGLWIRKEHYSGVLLPQVASEHGWDREEFLRHTCQKARLGPDEWRHGAEILAFSAEVFSAPVKSIEPLETLLPPECLAGRPPGH